MMPPIQMKWDQTSIWGTSGLTYVNNGKNGIEIEGDLDNVGGFFSPNSKTRYINIRHRFVADKANMPTQRFWAMSAPVFALRGYLWGSSVESAGSGWGYDPSMRLKLRAWHAVYANGQRINLAPPFEWKLFSTGKNDFDEHSVSGVGLASGAFTPFIDPKNELVIEVNHTFRASHRGYAYIRFDPDVLNWEDIGAGPFHVRVPEFQLHWGIFL